MRKQLEKWSGISPLSWLETSNLFRMLVVFRAAVSGIPDDQD